MENLLSFGRPLYPINLKRNSVLGVKAFPNIVDVPAAVDLAIIATPAITVPDVIGECAAAGVTGAVIISAGFRETGSAGRELEKSILARRARRGLRTAIVEGANIGGSSFHRGSYAVRALQACARQFRDRWKSGRFGNRVDLLKVTLNDWMTAQRMVTLRLVDDFRAELQRLNVDLIRGHGEFLDDRTLQVIDEHGLKSTVAADNIIVATGSRPDFQDSSRPRIVNSDQLLRGCLKSPGSCKASA